MSRTGMLLKKLHKGFVLYKDHCGSIETREFLISCGIGVYEMKGWGSALGTVEERLVELITNPEKWEVSSFNHIEQNYPYPWSTTYKNE